jgi:hypothetical protein
MIVLTIVSAILAASFQTAAADGARTALRTCIKAAAAEAKGQKVASEAFPGFVRQKCAAQETSFKSAVWAFDSRNKVTRKQSESDAEFQVDDFVTSAAGRYAADSPQN